MGPARSFLSRITLLALVGFPACQQSPVPSSSSNVTEIQERPELAMRSFRLQSYDGSALEWEMLGDRAMGFTQKSTTRAKNVRLRMFENGQKSTSIDADQALLNSGAGHPGKPPTTIEAPNGVTLIPGDMLFSGNVVAVSTDGTKLMTDWVHFQKQKDVIVSTAPVRVVRENSVTDGVGLVATSDMNRIQIFDQTVVIRENQPPAEEE